MKIEEILNLESQRKGLMLVRDRLFWQAWEYSAFLFVNHLRPYRIHRKIIKKVGGRGGVARVSSDIIGIGNCGCREAWGQGHVQGRRLRTVGSYARLGRF